MLVLIGLLVFCVAVGTFVDFRTKSKEIEGNEVSEQNRFLSSDGFSGENSNARTRATSSKPFSMMDKLQNHAIINQHSLSSFAFNVFMFSEERESLLASPD